MRYLLMGLLVVGLSGTAAADDRPKPPAKPIDCLAPNLPPREGIECLQRMRERASFEAMVKALSR